MMINFEDFGLAFRKGKENVHGFLLGNESDYVNKKIVLMGTGENSALCTMLLNKNGLDIFAYCDNNLDVQRINFLGKEVKSPMEFFKSHDTSEYFFIVTTKDFVYPTLKFSVNGITSYSYFFISTYYGFFEEPNKNTIFLKGIRNLLTQKFKNTNLSENSVVNPDVYDISKLLLTSIGWWKPVFSWLYDKLTTTSRPISVLEIGPGHGFLSYLMICMNPNITLDWIDLPNGYWKRYDNEKETTLDVEGKNLTVNVHLGEIENPNFVLNKKYDVVVMTEVFEHIRINPLPVFQRIVSYLKETGGEMFFSTPSWSHLPIYDCWKDMLSYTELKEMNSTFANSYFRHSYHYTHEELNEIFGLCDLKIIKYDLSPSNNHNFLLSK